MDKSPLQANRRCQSIEIPAQSAGMTESLRRVTGQVNGWRSASAV